MTQSPLTNPLSAAVGSSTTMPVPTVSPPRPPLHPHVIQDPFAHLPADDELRVLRIDSWDDGLHDVHGHDPRSAYVERFWLSILGPSALWLLRTFAYGLESSPGGFELDVSESAATIGLGGKVGRSGAFVRAVHRLCVFEHAAVQPTPPDEVPVLMVRRSVPWLAKRQLMRLPATLREEHPLWTAARQPSGVLAAMRQRAARLALDLVYQGEDVSGIERTLLRWRFHPALCRETAEWAWAAVTATTGDDVSAELAPVHDLSAQDLSGTGLSGTGLSGTGEATGA